MSNVPSLVVCRKLQQQANYDSLLGQAAGEDKGAAFQQRSKVPTWQEPGRQCQRQQLQVRSGRTPRTAPLGSPGSRGAADTATLAENVPPKQVAAASPGEGACNSEMHSLILVWPFRSRASGRSASPSRWCEPGSAPIPWPVSASGFALGEEGQSS